MEETISPAMKLDVVLKGDIVEKILKNAAALDATTEEYLIGVLAYIMEDNPACRRGECTTTCQCLCCAAHPRHRRLTCNDKVTVKFEVDVLAEG